MAVATAVNTKDYARPYRAHIDLQGEDFVIYVETERRGCWRRLGHTHKTQQGALDELTRLAKKNRTHWERVSDWAPRPL